MNKLIEKISQISDSIRYVAIYEDNKLKSWQHGDIGCGGLDFVTIKYGSFFQLIHEIKKGHISVCIDKKDNPIFLENEIKKMICKFDK